MSDFDGPTVDDTYVNALADVRDNQSTLAVMFNGVSASNIPVNAVNFEGGVFGLWNGATFVATPVSIGGGGTGATNAEDTRANLGVTSTIDADAKYMQAANNGSDIDDKSIFRTELDVYAKTQTYNKTEVDNKTAIASQAEAESGVDNTKLMTPLRVNQAVVDSRVPISIWSGPDTLIVSDADILSDTGFVVKSGTYFLLDKDNVESSVAVRDISKSTYGGGFSSEAANRTLSGGGGFRVSGGVDLIQIHYIPL